jgi:CubicO group peptidase (beta-lactamase class C family)
MNSSFGAKMAVGPEGKLRIMYPRSRRRFLAEGAKALGALTLAQHPARLLSQGDPSVGHGPRDEYWTAAVADLERRLPRLLEEFRVPGLSLALIRNSKIAWQRGFGVLDTASRARVDNDTVFSAQSMSKPVFAYVVMKLCEQRALRLDAPLTEYTREHFVEGDPRLELITARRVLSHTTGLPNLRSRNEPLKLSFTPGEKWSYSGEAYFYLQSVITRLRGRADPNNCRKYEADLNVCASDFDAYMKTNILRPFGMASSGYLWTPQSAKVMARPHDENGNPLPYRRPTTSDVARYGAMGGLLTTPSDFAKLLIEIIAPKPPDKFRLGADSRQEMLRPQVKVPSGEIASSWALGWRVLHTDDGDFIAHGGDGRGFHSMSVASVGRRTGFVVMTNGENGWQIIQKHLMTKIGRLI